jgi:hypothetical protein
MRAEDGARGVSVMPRPGTVGRVEAASFTPFSRGHNSRMTFRVMGPHEQGRFAPEAWGRLLQLKGSGALSAPELEQVIERALTHIDGRIALDDLRLLLEGVGVIDDTDGPSADRVH